MAEDLKGLIDKIQEDGVRAAEEKAKAIEEEAGRRARAMIASAEKKADALIASARDNIAKMEASSMASLKQSGRDLLLTLHKEVVSMLEKIVVSEVREAMSAEEMAKVITGLVKDYVGAKKDSVEISLKKEEADKLQKCLASELGAEARKGITLKPSDDIRGGFLISFDSGKSHYDFTDKALAEYLGAYLKPKLAEMLKAVSGE